MSEGRYLNCVVKREKELLLGSRRKNKCSETHVLVIRTFCGQTGGGGGELVWGPGRVKIRCKNYSGCG